MSNSKTIIEIENQLRNFFEIFYNKINILHFFLVFLMSFIRYLKLQQGQRTFVARQLVWTVTHYFWRLSGLLTLVLSLIPSSRSSKTALLLRCVFHWPQREERWFLLQSLNRFWYEINFEQTDDDNLTIWMQSKASVDVLIFWINLGACWYMNSAIWKKIHRAVAVYEKNDLGEQ